MKIELVNNIPNEAKYQLQYQKNIHLAYEKIHKILLIFYIL